MTVDRNALLVAAAAWHTAGAAVLPVRVDGTKAPGLPTWKQWQHTRPDIGQMVTWVTGDTDGIGILTGATSGGLEMLELEGRCWPEGIADAFDTLAADNGIGDLLARIRAGYSERSGGNGQHLIYRVLDPAGRPAARRNTKLARRPATADELAASPGERVKVLIETRGEGGFVVVAPSAGRTRSDGGAWVTLSGGPADVATITEDERDALWAVASMLDQMPATVHAAESTAAAATRLGAALAVDGNRPGMRPGDDYDARTSWDDILTPLGWTRVCRMGSGHGWRRPGKSLGLSATTGQAADGVDRLYVFTTSTEFEAERPYTKFAAYTLLEHGGDYGAAAKALRSAGFGQEPARPVLTVLQGGNLTAGSNALAAPAPRPAATLEHSEDGHALALVDEHGAGLRYCPEKGRWLAWDGSRWDWQESGGGRAREYAKAVARAMPETDPRSIAHKRRSLSAAGTTACLQQAATDPRIIVRLEHLDAHPWDLNTPGGILDLRTGGLRPADPTRLHTRITACTPDPDADPAAWAAFLDDTFRDPALAGYIQRLVGYSAVGVVREHVLPFGHGCGANGKTVLLETVAGVLGDYATSAPSGFLMAAAHAQHETEIARLAGARFVVCSEINEGDRFDEAKVKLLTGGDRLTARFMRRDHFTFTPSHHLWLVGNHQPSVRSGGLSFWRRVRLLPFAHTVPEDKRVEDLATRLITDHGPAVLAWVAAGAAAYATGGLAEPVAVTSATAAYERDSDTVGRFVEDRCSLGGGDLVKAEAPKVHAAYESWCAEEGEQPVSGKALNKALRERFGAGYTRSHGRRFFTGLGLLEVAPGGDDDGRGWFG